MIDLATFQPPEYQEFKRPHGGKFMPAFRIDPYRHPKTTPPPPLQVGLFPTLEERLEPELIKIMAKRRSKKARLKMISDKLDCSVKEAEKAMAAVLARLREQYEYDDYLRNKEWYAWVHTPEHREYMRLFAEDLARQRAEEQAKFDKAIAEGREHVIHIGTVDSPEVLRMLDNPSLYDNGTMSAPVSYAIRHRLTENDLRIMLARGYAKVVYGDERTLFTAHTYYQWTEADEKPRYKEYEPPVCSVCGKELTYNEVGLCSKLGWNDICQKCAGVSDEWVKDTIRFYKSSGCNLFI